MDKVLSYELVDYNSLLLLTYKNIGLDEKELVVMQLLMVFSKSNEDLTTNLLKQYMTCTIEEIDRILVSLIQKKVIEIVGARIDISRIYKILQMSLVEKKEKEKVDLLKIFEAEFGRTLSPMEVDSLRMFKREGFKDEMIIDALREAIMRNARSLRYIETILRDWQINGVKKTFKEKVPAKKEEYIAYEWWNDD